MTLIDMITGSADPAATLKNLLAGKEGDALKKSVKDLADAGLEPDLLVPYSEDAIESLLANAERAADAAADDVTAMLDDVLQKAKKTAEQPAETTFAQASAEHIEAIAEKVYERLGGDELKKSLKGLADKLDRQQQVLEKSGRLLVMTLGEELRKSGRTQAAAPADRSTATAGTPGSKRLGRKEAKATFKRSLRLAEAKGDQAAIETLTNGAILLDALKPGDTDALNRVDTALKFAVSYEG